jgi:quinoprotein glucose dehydrogenase
MRYSDLRQINRSNVTQLRPVWIFHTGDLSDKTKWPVGSAFEATPLVANNVMYVTTPFSRLIALDPETGREFWSFDPRIDRNESGNLFINRGVAFWTDGHSHRLLLGTLDGRLFSIIAETGKPDLRFGLGGWIDLRAGAADQYPNRLYGMTSPPAIFRNLVICGSLVSDGEARGPSGDVRAFDVRTGKLAWTFHTVPRAGEFGNDTWPVDAWKQRGGVNAWSPLSVDLDRGIVFLPLTSPATDSYGWDREGANLFGDSLVALDASTGKRLWHFQIVHHDIWDYDLPAQPVLVRATRNGELVDAVAQVTKTGFTFVFDRATGDPLFPIEEVPVPKSPIPGEAAAPTQPRPLKPPPYARQQMTADDLTDVTPESHAYCSKLLEGAEMGRLFTPIGLQPTVIFPGTNGGANWGGASFDPETHTLYVNSMDVGMMYRMVKRADGTGVPYRPGGSGSLNSRFWDPDQLPCQKPPWGQLTAIDLDTGTFRWRSVLGVVDKLIEKGLPPTGAPNIGGSLVTAGGLVFIGATNDSRFRAFDKDTGQALWTTRLPASGHASPMTFLAKNSGKQFVVIAAGGGNKYSSQYSDSLVAFALPSVRGHSPTLVHSSRAIFREDTGSAPRRHSPVAAQGSNAGVLFSHKRHGKLKIECTYCHETATTAERAMFPKAQRCMSCHRAVAVNSPVISRLAALPGDEIVAPKLPVYRLPDFVFFSHARHAPRVTCESCHGDVWSQESIRPVLQMKMKACGDCHLASHATVACTACHELNQ